MSEKRLRLYELLAANTLDRRDVRERWRWAKVLEKAMIGMQGKKALKKVKS